MKFGITIILLSCLGLLYIPTCNALCTKNLLDSCIQKLNYARAGGSTSHYHVCKIVDDYLACRKPCGKEKEARIVAYAKMSTFGIKCGSSMATLSGALGILTVLATLKNYFEHQLSF